jgi:hypothetical protein
LRHRGTQIQAASRFSGSLLRGLVLGMNKLQPGKEGRALQNARGLNVIQSTRRAQRAKIVVVFASPESWEPRLSVRKAAPQITDSLRRVIHLSAINARGAESPLRSIARRIMEVFSRV